MVYDLDLDTRDWSTCSGLKKRLTAHVRCEGSVIIVHLSLQYYMYSVMNVALASTAEYGKLPI